MSTALLKAFVALMPAGLVFSGAIVLFVRVKTLSSFVQLVGSGCLMMVVLVHVFEALHLFPWMDWGMQDSAGHYVDLWSAVVGLTLFPVGYFVHALTQGRANDAMRG